MLDRSLEPSKRLQTGYSCPWPRSLALGTCPLQMRKQDTNAICFCRVLKNPVVTAPIIGISNARSLDDALKAIHVKLSEEDIKEIEDAYSVRPNQGFS